MPKLRLVFIIGISGKTRDASNQHMTTMFCLCMFLELTSVSCMSRRTNLKNCDKKLTTFHKISGLSDHYEEIKGLFKTKPVE